MKLSRPFSLIPFLFFFLTFNFILCSSLPLPYSPVINIAINCGSSRNLNASDGRVWSGDAAHDPIPLNHEGNSMKSNALHLPPWLDIIPYATARISHSQFGYTFHAISPGPTFIRLHFHLASYHGFERAKPLFSVKAGPYTLINNFSASLTKDCSKFKYCVKEFSLSVRENYELKVMFSPIPSSSHDTYAFVNGIEIISMPQSLYYSRDDEVGAPVVGQKYRFYIDNGTAMEMVQRLNIGGRFISPVEDSGLFRAWFPDTKYLLQTETISISTSKVVKYTKLPSYIAPMEVYRTARSISPHNGSLSWKFAVDLGFRYLVRLHFCKLNYEEGVSGDKGFNIFIKDEIAEAYANVLKWSGGDRVAIYRDYVVVMEGDKVEGKRDLFLTLTPNDKSTYLYRLAVLNGLEIFKLSNPDNTLAGPNFVADQTYKSLKVNKVLLLFIVVNVIGLIIIIFSVVSHVFRHWNKEKSRKTEAPQQFSEGLSRCFSIAEIRSATDNFNENLIIGIGGFGKVYKGVIDNGATTVAIKRQNEKSSQGDIEFRAEIEMLSKLRHVHLVSLIGYCKDGEEMILIYDYMACGTLADHLYRRSLSDHIYKNHQNPPPLSWRERLEICIGAARGLEYLHTGLHRKIIHRDVKATNILLDENRVAKISDFGLSRLGPTSLSLSEVTTNLVKGTPGYLDPEYYRSGRPTVKSDVYSFGVVLFEVLSGRRAVDMRFKEEERKSLAKWAPRCVKEERIDQITDPFLHGKIASQCLAVFIEIASRCIEDQRQKRPTMAEVVRKLESVLAEQEKWNTGISHEININVIDKNVVSDDDQIEDERSPLCPKEIEMAKVSGPPPEMLGIARTWPGLFFQYGASSSSEKLKERITILIQKMGFNRKGSDIDVKRRVRHSSPDLEPTCFRVRNPQSHRARSRYLKASQSSEELCRRFSLEEIQAATKNFNSNLKIIPDEGGLDEVYKGCIHGEISNVAIRRLKSKTQITFWAEMDMLCRVRYHHINPLIGYCNNETESALVFAYAANGTLYDHLHNKTNHKLLSWTQRLRICIGAARGLHFLHTNKNSKIIHGNVNTRTIVLGEKMVPMISDFWLIELGASNDVNSGYLDPEYHIHQQLTEKSDVYSFGVVLFEVLCARPSMDLSLDEDQISLAKRAPMCFREGKLDEIMDPCLIGKIAPKCLRKYWEIAENCLGNKRPSMSDVAVGLEFVLQLQTAADAVKDGDEPYTLASFVPGKS